MGFLRRLIIPTRKPFRTWIDGPLMTFVAWCALGVFGALGEYPEPEPRI